MKIKSMIPCFVIASALSSNAFAEKTAKPKDPREKEVKVQIAILLDTSSSMNGLIEQTKTQLWRTVNTFITARKDGVTPFVEVALYEYGNDGLAMTSNYVRQVVPLSRNLDSISEHLFSLRTNGGSEFCGVAIQNATNQLEWDDSKDVYKAIFIAGNEPFTQGPVDPMVICKNAYEKDIVVNTIHCGDHQTGVSQGWKSGASLAAGNYLVINADKKIRHIECPQDVRISELNTELNKTYIPYGVRGRQNHLLQRKGDQNALKHKLSGADVQRAITKASVNYLNTSWDLVDASAQDGFKLEEVAKETLPKKLQDMDITQRRDYVKQQGERRAELQKQILKLNQERATYETAERKRLAEDGEDTLDEAMIATVREQAKVKGYHFTK